MGEESPLLLITNEYVPRAIPPDAFSH